MKRWVILLCVLLGCGLLLELAAQDRGSCVQRCNQQYAETVRNCKEVYAKKKRKDWYSDCIKNARKFRRQCLRGCR